ncbi:hypothetical protein V6N12_068982 [Hibiscus sabdariffa]|uniref:CCHC-type domain-containing protein n=1 Tax=Hibiscus sabdariffa TaxID=183260 RepID=A0ABR2CAE1_9ROSI
MASIYIHSKAPIQQPKQPGRPKTKRKKEPYELTSQREKCAKLRKIEVSMTCSKCGQQGHNKRSCEVISQNMDSQQSNDERITSSQDGEQDRTRFNSTLIVRWMPDVGG